MRKLISMLLAVCLVLSVPLNAFAATWTPSVDKTTVKAGEDVTVTITLDEDIPNVTTLNYKLYFNSDLFTLKSSSNGNTHSDMKLSAVRNDDNGKGDYYNISYLNSDSEGVTMAAGTVYTLIFTAIEDVAEDQAATFNLVFDNCVDPDFNNIEAAAGAAVTVTVAHTHTYEEVVTAPTCEAEGYTTHTCSCGDSYVDTYTDPTGHDYVDGVCSVCNDIQTVLPEGARFINVTTDVEGVPVVEEPALEEGFKNNYGELPYYHLVIPEGAQFVYITYPENSLSVSQWSYASAIEMKLPYYYENMPANIEPQVVTNADNSQTVSIAVKDYITQIPSQGTGIIMRNEIFEFGEMFTIGYQIADGYYDVGIPTSERYTVTGETVATDGYTFKVSINDGYVAGEDFAVKVNGETVGTTEGSYTVASVTERVIITVEGVLLEVGDSDLFINVDLTEVEADRYLDSSISWEGVDVDWTYTEGVASAGETTTFSYSVEQFESGTLVLGIGNADGKFSGFKVGDVVCEFTGSYKQYTINEEIVGYMQNIKYSFDGVDYDFLQFEIRFGNDGDMTTPGTWDIVPMLASDEVPATAITLDKTELTLTVGGEETLTPTVTPTDTTDEVVWTSSDSAVATVENGKVTAVAAGEATITATAGDVSATCAVTVNAAEEEEPDTSGAPFTVTVGGEAMTAITYDEASTLYTVTIPAGSTEATITWAEGTFTLSQYDGTNGGYLMPYPAVASSHTVSPDCNSDGVYDKLQVYDSGWNVPYWIAFTSAAAEPEEPEEPAAPFTVTIGGEAMTAITYDEASTLYTVTIPAGSTEATITWAEGTFTLSQYDGTNGGYLMPYPAMASSHTVSPDCNSDGVYDKLQVYDSGWNVPYWIAFTSAAAEPDEPDEPSLPFTVTVGGEAMTEFTTGEIKDPYNGTKTLYTFTIPANSTEATITWAEGTYTISYYDGTSNAYIGMNSGHAASKTVTTDYNGDGTYDNIQVYDSGWSVPYWIAFTSEGGDGGNEEETITGAFKAEANGVELTDITETANGYMGMVTLYTVTVPAGTEEVTLSWNTAYMYESANADYSETFTSDYDAKTSHTVSVDASNDGEMDYILVMNSSYSPVHAITFVEEVSEPEIPAATGIKLNNSALVENETGAATNYSLNMAKGSSQTLTVTLEPAGAQDTVNWASSDESVATVENGVITAVGKGTTTVIAYIGELAATAADEGSIIASVNVTVSEGYTVSASADEDVAAGESAEVSITVTNTDGNAYNAYMLDITYPEGLTYVSASGSGVQDDSFQANHDEITRTIQIIGYGADKASGTAAAKLTFTGSTAGEYDVTITSAKVDAAASAPTQDTPDATITDAATKITIGGYTVTLGEGLTADSTVAYPGTDYTFKATDYSNYNYTVTAKIGDNEITVTDNKDGTYTIPADQINGNITVTAVMTPKTYKVTIIEDGTTTSTTENAATYNVDYTFTPEKEGHSVKSIAVTIDNNPYTIGNPDENGTYTIPGTAITGDIVITIEWEEITSDSVKVNKGEGVSGGETATKNEDYKFSFTETDKYNYTDLKVEIGEGDNKTDITDKVTYDEATGEYTIPGELITGPITITVTRTEKSPLTIDVVQYLTLDETVGNMYLVTVTGVPEGSVAKYDGQNMYWSAQIQTTTEEGTATTGYGAYAWLVISTEGLEAVKTAASEKVTTAVETSNLTVSYSGDVNGTTKIDVNDAQLVYNMYNAYHNSFDETNGGASMQKFLNADMNGDKTVSTADAAAVVYAIINPQQ